MFNMEIAAREVQRQSEVGPHLGVFCNQTHFVGHFELIPCILGIAPQLPISHSPVLLVRLF